MEFMKNLLGSMIPPDFLHPMNRARKLTNIALSQLESTITARLDISDLNRQMDAKYASRTNSTAVHDALPMH